jgi:DNA repair exonuclease SbcCD nuclease subunit
MYSDLHLREERKEDCGKVLDKVLDIALRIQDKIKQEVVVLNGGDTFNTRGLIRTSCFDLFYSKCQLMHEKGLKKIILVGNHDQEDKAGEIHPMRVFSKWSGWYVVDKPMVIPEFKRTIFFPYMSPTQVNAWLDTDESGAKFKDYDAFVHWGIRGAKRNDHNTDNDGVPVEWLGGFRNVFSGHYHYRSVYKNVQYIGSPIQQNFGEMGQEKGLMFYSQKSGKKQFIELKGFPIHREIELDSAQLDDTEFKNDMTNDFLRVIVKGDAESCARVTQGWISEKINARDIKIERKVSEKHYSRLNLKSTDVLNQEQIMSKYVDFIETKLDRKRLMDVGRELAGLS